MHPKSLAVVVVLLSNACAATSDRPERHELETPSAIESEALAVVKKRTDAYNAHDIDAFAATYDPDVRVYEYPDDFLGEGVERLKRIFGAQFADGEGAITVIRQRALENTVVSEESVTFYGKTEANIGIYTVENGQIVEVRLIEPND